MNQETISYGTASCGHVGQIFRTGKCAHCYIADLEKLIDDAKLGCDKITEALTGTSPRD